MLNWCGARTIFKGKNKIGIAFWLKCKVPEGINPSFSAVSPTMMNV